MSMRSIFILFALLINTVLFAQIEHGGMPWSFRKNSVTQQLQPVVMPAINVQELLFEDSLDALNNEPYRFGKEIPVNLEMNNSGTWEHLKNGDALWRLRIKSAGAYSLNLIFSEFYMPEGGRMFVYSADRSTILGAFTAENNKPHGKFSTTVLKGDDIIVEYYEPAHVAGQGRIAVNYVVHGYRNIFFKRSRGGNRDFDDSGNCNVDVVCPSSAGWENQINASLLYLLSNNTRVCSGSMLNNVRQDQTPYFLSANHCYSGDYATWIFLFNYQSAQCSPTIDGPTNMTVSGSSLKARRNASDFMLFELSSTPPLNYNVYYAGWSNIDVAPTSAVGIHHPAGDVKKISFENDPCSSSGYFGGGNDHWEVNDWDSGTTEGGSSGSPLFDQNGRVVGQLHGGSAACGNNLEDYYGKFSLSWNGGNSSNTRLRDWLDPDNTGATTLDGVSFNVPQFTLDASVLSIDNVEDNTCETEVNAEVRILNNGATAITAMVLNVTVDGNPAGTQSWSGNIAFGQSATINLNSLTLNPGAHTIAVSLASVNGGTDQESTNDSASESFTIIQGEDLIINLTTDDYGDETTIYVYDNSSNLIYSQTGFGDNQSYQISLCLAPACYQFVITDDYFDGICCSYGNGAYSVVLPDGSTAGSGGQFGQQDQVNFCVVQAIAPVADFSVSDTLSCTGSAVTFNDESANSPTNWNWTFQGGTPATSTLQNPTVSWSAAGTYSVSLQVANSGGNDVVSRTGYIAILDAPDVSFSSTDVNPAGAGNGSTSAIPNDGRFYTIVWSTGDTTAFLNDLQAGTYTATATDEYGCSVSQTLTVEETVGIGTLEELDVNIYPNPADHVINISMQGVSSSYILSVVDPLGRVVLQQEQVSGNVVLDVAALHTGVYFVRITSLKGSAIKKVFIR